MLKTIALFTPVRLVHAKANENKINTDGGGINRGRFITRL